jgi:hypothetical protein
MELRVTTGRRSRRAGHDKGYTPSPHPLGHELRGVGEGWQGPVFLAVFVLAFGAAAVVSLVIALGEGATPAWYFAVAFGLVELLLMTMFAKMVRVRRSWEESRLILDTWPLLIGGSAKAWFARPREDTRSTPRPAAARLVLRETATYQVGTDTRTVTDDAQTFPLTLERGAVDGIDGFHTTITIPPDGPPTIQLDSNLVEWIMEVEFDEDAGPGTGSRFTVLVAPRRARA